MSKPELNLKPFEHRVRLVRSWRGAAIGACIGASVCAVWAVLDWKSIVYTEWTWLGVSLLSWTILGAIVGASRKISPDQLAMSVDRRAGLEDRLTTAQERSDAHDAFDVALQNDAHDAIARVQAKTIYPIRLNRFHGISLTLCVIAAAIFMMGNSPVILSEEQKKARQELKKQGQVVERVTKENFESPEALNEMNAAEKRLADQMRELRKDLEKARMSPEEAMQRSNEISQKAEQLMQQSQNAMQQDMAQAQTIQDQMEKADSMGDMSPTLSAQLTPMSKSDKAKMLNEAKKQAKQIQKELEQLRKRLAEILKKLANPNLSSKERELLEAEKKELEKSISELEAKQKENESLQKALQLSQEARDVFKKLANDPLFKKIANLMRKLERDASSASKSGKGKLTDEERKQIKEQLEKLAQELKDPAKMKAYLEAMLKALEDAKRLGRCNNAMLGISGLPSMPGMLAPPGAGAPSEDTWMGDNHHVYKLDKPAESKGKTTTSVISGDVREANGPQPYVEIKAPTVVGNRSSVPYSSVLPSYSKKAESALNRQEIPKQHQKRVKEYFDSLTGAGKG